MKHFTLTLFFLIYVFNLCVSAQGTSINASGTPADQSSMLDVNASDKGILIPRIALTDTSDATTIQLPAVSLLIYNTTSVNGLVQGYFYNAGTPASPRWKQLLPNPANADLSMANFKITNLATCTQNLDAANKAYVDAQVAQVGGSGGASLPVMMSDESVSLMNFRQACDYCKTLSEGGFTDWRMPTFDDYVYLISTSANPIPNDVSANYFWLGTQDPEYGYRYTTVSLYDGALSRNYGYNTQKVRCVR